MESFWKWLRGTNARAVFVAALLALVAVTAWWIWKEYAPPGNEEGHIPSSGSKEKEPEALAIIAKLDQEAMGRSSMPARDPFQSPFRVPEPQPVQQPPPQQPAPKPPQPPKVEPPPPPKVEPPPPPPKPHESVVLTYKG
ncbi:MAG: hypothetical protein ACUVWX_15040, partial [Kiritimatiellia bacterium]